MLPFLAAFSKFQALSPSWIKLSIHAVKPCTFKWRRANQSICLFPETLESECKGARAEPSQWTKTLVKQVQKNNWDRPGAHLRQFLRPGRQATRVHPNGTQYMYCTWQKGFHLLPESMQLGGTSRTNSEKPNSQFFKQFWACARDQVTRAEMTVSVVFLWILAWSLHLGTWNTALCSAPFASVHSWCRNESPAHMCTCGNSIFFLHLDGSLFHQLKHLKVLISLLTGQHKVDFQILNQTFGPQHFLPHVIELILHVMDLLFVLGP